MEEILNKIIEIDNNAKKIIEEEKNRKNNIEDVIESEFTIKKAVIDLEFKDEIKKQEENAKSKFNEKKKIIDEHLKIELENIKKDFSDRKDTIIADVVNSIINEEE